MLKHIKHIHFVGIGGAGMSGIAELLLNSKEYIISGSDTAFTPITQNLEKLGAQVYPCHNKENIKSADVVVYSSAIKPWNPELKQARKLKIPTIPRIEILAELMRLKEGIAIAGTHGKTTTTSMIGHLLETAGLDPTIVVGGKLRTVGSSATDACLPFVGQGSASGGHAKIGKGKFLVCEADESDKLFLKLSPIINIITSIDDDHLDKYKDIDEIRKTFLKFTSLVPFYGCNILCEDNENIKLILPKIKKRYITYGFSPTADIRISDYSLGSPFPLKSPTPTLFSIQYPVSSIQSPPYRDPAVAGYPVSSIQFKLFLPGIHNILNATASIALGIEMGIPMDTIKNAVPGFRGTHRRFEFKGEAGGITVMDDYAHHPTEIIATLSTAKQVFKLSNSKTPKLSNSKLFVVFQPHLFSRTQKLSEKFGKCFKDADFTILVPIYSPKGRDAPCPSVSPSVPIRAIIKSAMASGYKNIKYIAQEKDLFSYCLSTLKKGDVLFTIGAGDIYKFGENLLAALNKY